jgi:hypothetical protein
MGDVVLDVAFQLRPPTAILDHVLATLPEDHD